MQTTPLSLPPSRCSDCWSCYAMLSPTREEPTGHNRLPHPPNLPHKHTRLDRQRAAGYAAGCASGCAGRRCTGALPTNIGQCGPHLWRDLAAATGSGRRRLHIGQEDAVLVAVGRGLSAVPGLRALLQLLLHLRVRLLPHSAAPG